MLRQAPVETMTIARALARGLAAPASSPTQSGIHWTAPHVPTKTTETMRMPMSVGRRSSGPKTSPSLERCGTPASRAAERSHFSDSGTKRRMSKVRTAGEAPMRKWMRQEASSAGYAMAITPTSTMPRLAAMPMAAAILERCRSGQASITSATPRAHSPPMPSAARKRAPARCQGSVAK